MEKISEFFNNLFENVQGKPAIAGLVISSIGLFLLLAVIFDADWMLEGGNGFFNIASISKMFGRNVARVLMGIVCIILIVAGITLVWAYK